MARLKAARQAPWQVGATAHTTVSEDGQQGRADENNGRECGGRGEALRRDGETAALHTAGVHSQPRQCAGHVEGLRVGVARAHPQPVSRRARGDQRTSRKKRDGGAPPPLRRGHGSLSATHSPLGDGHGALPREVVEGAAVRRPRRLPKTRCARPAAACRALAEDVRRGMPRHLTLSVEATYGN